MDITSYILGRKSSGGGAGALKYLVVDELPQVGEDNTIYLVPKSTSKTNNYYDEYMYIENEWELIGDTEIDLSNYAQKNEVLTKTNTTAFTPTGDYQPATKKYVDDNAGKIYFIKDMSDLTSSGDLWKKAQQMIDDYNSGKYSLMYKVGSGNIGYRMLPKDNQTFGVNDVDDIIHLMKQNNNTYTLTSLGTLENSFGGNNSYTVMYDLRFFCNITVDNQNKIISIQQPTLHSNFQSEVHFLSTTKNYSRPYTPQYDGSPATKKYVDEIATTYSGYDATKTQVLKNVNGVLTWVDE